MSLGNGDKVSDCVSEIITKLTKDVIQVYSKQGKDAAWVTIRATTKTRAFDIPRWHMDGAYYSSSPEERPKAVSKVVTALKGAGTLLYNLPYASRSPALNDLLKGSSDPKNKAHRIKLRDAIDRSKVLSLEIGQGAVFLAGVKHAAIHSEPPIKEPRLFLSIVPGNVDEIEKIKTKQ